MIIKFYRERDKPYGVFSNFSPHGFNFQGIWWPTVEHFFQAQKFEDQTICDLIRNARSPMDAKNLGNSREYLLKFNWEAIKDNVMLQGVQSKFEQNENILSLLLSTEQYEIIEDAPNDYYWGIGADGTGKNMLGKILMIVRENMRP